MKFFSSVTTKYTLWSLMLLLGFSLYAQDPSPTHAAHMPWPSQDASDLLSSVEQSVQFLQEGEKKGEATYGWCIWDLSEAQPMKGHRDQQTFVPASVTKLFTTASALLELGAHYSYTTNIFTAGPISPKGELYGDLIIAGCGDPSVASKYFPSDWRRLQNTIEQVCQTLGIKKIVGRVVIDASLWCPEGYNSTWAAGDFGKPYAAAVYAWNMFDNQLGISLRSSSAGTSPSLSARPEPLGIELENAIQTRKRRGSGVYIKSMGKQNKRSLHGYMTPNSTAFVSVDIPNPADLGARLLQQQLQQLGVDVTECTPLGTYTPLQTREKRKLVAQYLSPSIAQICRITNVHSRNPYAEALLKTIPIYQGRCTDTQEATKLVELYWQKQVGIPPHQLKLFDGSGLSRSNRISPFALCKLLHHMYYIQEVGTEFMGTLPQAGKEGTVKSLAISGNKTLLIKSGTMRGIRCYAGYVQYKNKTYALAFMANNIQKPAAAKASFLQAVETAFP